MEFKPFKIGKYLLLERLATGGMAEVYRAKASGAGGFEKQLAIKRILPSYSQNEEFRRMFEYEARLSSMLTHANIVQIYDFAKYGETYLLAMEYVDGKNLRQFVNKARKVTFAPPIEFGVYVINEVCKGLDYAHKKKDDLSGKSLNIIHRDMSPQNIMLSYDGAVKIVDFGIAKAKDRVDETRSGVIKGKFGYMSPEQANGEPVDHRTDIFSTGIILYELLTGKRLFAADNDMATLKQIQECVIPPARSLNPKIPPELEKILMKSLTKDLTLRYHSAGLFHRNLQEFLNKYYPSFTQREVAEILQKTFSDEIANEKKRFEQIYRQSIPFSQGSEEPDPGTREEVNEALDGDITKSEARDRTAVTYVSDEESIREEGERAERDFEGSIQSHVSGSGTADGESTKAGVAESGPHEPTKVEPILLEDESVPTEAISQRPEEVTGISTPRDLSEEPVTKPGVEEKDTFTSEKTLVKERGKKISSLSPLGGEAAEEGTPSGISLSAPSATGTNRRRDRSISALTEISGRGNEPVSLGKQEEPPSLSVEPAPPPERHWQEPFRMQDPEPAPPPKKRSLTQLVLVVTLVLFGAIWWRQNMESPKQPSVSADAGSAASSPDSGQTAAPSVDNRAVTNDVGARPPEAKPIGDCAIEVNTDPSGARIYADGVDHGLTPNTISAVCGKNTNLTLKLDGYEPVSENLVFKAHAAKLNRTLKKVPTGVLELLSTANATVYIDGEPAGEITANQKFEKPLRAGRTYHVRFVNEIRGIDESYDFSITEDQINRQNLRLGEGFGKK